MNEIKYGEETIQNCINCKSWGFETIVGGNIYKCSECGKKYINVIPQSYFSENSLMPMMSFITDLREILE